MVTENGFLGFSEFEVLVDDNANNLQFQGAHLHLNAIIICDVTGLSLDAQQQNFGFVMVENSGTQNVTLKANDVNSDIGNRFAMTSDIILAPGEGALFAKRASGYYYIPFG